MGIKITPIDGAAELPKYQCHKVVGALKIGGISGTWISPQEPFKPFEVDTEWLRKHEPQVGGYVVFYEDGYVSYSPAAAFESGYTKIRHPAGGTLRGGAGQPGG